MKVDAMWKLYQNTIEWKNLTPSSRRIYLQGAGYIEEFMTKDADKISRPMVLDFRDRNFDKKAKCRLGLQVLGLIMRFGYDRGYCLGDPTRAIRSLPPKKGWERWTQEEIDAVMKAADQSVRDAITLALYTGQRRSDLVLMRWDNYDGSYIHIIQKKTRKPISIPVHPVLKKELERMRNDNKGETILVSKTGERWMPDYLTDSVTTVARSLGIDKVLHGLRKTTASVLAEHGCTPHEIAAITGQSLYEVIKYTRGAEQKELARRAVDRWKNSISS